MFLRVSCVRQGFPLGFIHMYMYQNMCIYCVYIFYGWRDAFRVRYTHAAEYVYKHSHSNTHFMLHWNGEKMSKTNMFIIALVCRKSFFCAIYMYTSVRPYVRCTRYRLYFLDSGLWCAKRAEIVGPHMGICYAEVVLNGCRHRQWHIICRLLELGKIDIDGWEWVEPSSYLFHIVYQIDGTEIYIHKSIFCVCHITNMKTYIYFNFSFFFFLFFIFHSLCCAVFDCAM